MSINDYQSISDLAKRARRRIPHYAWEYLDCGTGLEECLARNRADFERIVLVPRFLKGQLAPNIETELFGVSHAAPFGIAPVGLAGLIWPKAEIMLANCAARNRLPCVLSTVANETPEVFGPIAGDMAWFQLYPPRDLDLRRDLLTRVRDSGFKVLVVTADVPMSSRRERQERVGLTAPPRITPRMLYWSAIRPRWALETLMTGPPRFKTLEKYTGAAQLRQVSKFFSENLGGTLSWDYLKEVRDEWRGPLILKGLLHPRDAEIAIDAGVDGISVSNHGGRQFDGAPSALSVLPEIKRTVNGRAKVIYDSGVRNALDIARAIALGADFVLLGRAFMFGVAAFGEKGGDHVSAILKDELVNIMHQMGCASVEQLSSADWRDQAASIHNNSQAEVSKR